LRKSGKGTRSNYGCWANPRHGVCEKQCDFD
jgi:hypothetical protein